MKPDIATVLDLLGECITADAMAALGPGYASAQLQRGVQLLAALANPWSSRTSRALRVPSEWTPSPRPPRMAT